MRPSAFSFAAAAALALTCRGATIPTADVLLEKRAVTAGIFNFTQRVNHFPNSSRYGPPPAKPTFTMRYTINDTFYEPGGPVICLLGGETSLESRAAYIETGIVSILAKATHGLGVILEHRYYGDSYATEDLTTDNMRWLTTEQNIADVAYFAQNIVFAGHEKENLKAPRTPWILYGGSMAGAETAFTVKTYGDIIYGGIASSGTTYARVAYPEWYYTIQKNAPQDCVKSIEDNTDRIDKVLESKDPKAIAKLKSIFGLESVKDDQDFAVAIAMPIGNPFTYITQSWQELNWDPTFGSNDFYEFCGNVTRKDSPANVTAVDGALSGYTGGEKWTGLGNWADYFKRAVIPLCDSGDLNSPTCFGYQNESYWSDTALDPTENRQYLWQSCTELGAFSQGAPSGRRTLLSRTVQPARTYQWCRWAFPAGKYAKLPQTVETERWNRYGGYGVAADRLAIVDGGEDPWQYACPHSPTAPKRKNTLLRPSYVIPPGGHHWDENGLPNINDEPGYIQKIHHYEIQFVRSWLKDFKSWRPKKTDT